MTQSGGRIAASGGHRWSARYWWIFAGFFVGMMLEAYIYSLSAVATGWVHEPRSLDTLLLIWSPLWLIIGIMVSGPISDHVGRKRTFILTMTLYAAGGILLVFSYSYVLILIAIAVLLFAAGGEMNTIMASAQELFPSEHRGKAYAMLINGVNLGAIVLAVIALASAYKHVSFQRATIGVTILAAVLVLIATRLRIPESPLWLQRVGQGERATQESQRYLGEDITKDLAQPQPSKPASSRAPLPKSIPFALLLFVTAGAAFANTNGFALMGFALGPFFFPHDVALIILIANAAAFIGGLGGLFNDRVSRRGMLLWSTVITLALAIVIRVTMPEWTRDLSLFWVLLFLMYLPAGTQYVTEDCLKSEVWPTRRRGTFTALARFISIGTTIPLLFLTQHLSMQSYTLFAICVWAVGAIAAAVWYVLGRETGRGATILVASGESEVFHAQGAPAGQPHRPGHAPGEATA